MDVVRPTGFSCDYGGIPEPRQRLGNSKAPPAGHSRSMSRGIIQHVNPEIASHHMRLRGLQLAVPFAPVPVACFCFEGACIWAGANSITIDARTASQTPRPSSYHGGTLSSPSGHTIGINSMYLTMDGRPWLPVMGEFHYSRVPESEWEEELLKMKSAGVQIVSTYVIWIHHEEIRRKIRLVRPKGSEALR